MAADQLAVLEPYLLDVRGGRPTKPQLVEEFRARYARIGGRSPILEHTRAQAAGVGRALGTGFRTYAGMRHWHPYIKDSVAEIRRAGTQRVVGVVMAPHYSGMSVGAYEKKLLEAAHESEPLEVALVRSWWEQPAFLDTMANRVRQALQRFPKPSEVQVIFTAHSLPERILAAHVVVRPTTPMKLTELASFDVAHEHLSWPWLTFGARDANSRNSGSASEYSFR